MKTGVRHGRQSDPAAVKKQLDAHENLPVHRRSQWVSRWLGVEVGSCGGTEGTFVFHLATLSTTWKF